MARTKQIIALLMIAILLMPGICFAQEESIEEFFYGSTFRPVNRFVVVSVNVQAEESLGLNEENLTSYARLRFKNNFRDIPFAPSDDILSYTEEAGHLSITIWAVGTTYPIAYHMEIKAGNMKNFHAYYDAVLGYCDSKVILERARSNINKLIEDFAMAFYKARKEI